MTTAEPKMTVWCNVGKAGLVIPSFFENHNGNAVTVNFERYIEMIKKKKKLCLDYYENVLLSDVCCFSGMIQRRTQSVYELTLFAHSSLKKLSGLLTLLDRSVH